MNKFFNIFKNEELLKTSKTAGFFAFIFVALIITSLLSVRYYLYQNIIVNGIAQKTILAKNNFEVIDKQRTELIKREVANKIRPIVVPVEGDYIKVDLQKAIDEIEKIRKEKKSYQVKQKELFDLLEINDSERKKTAITYILNTSDTNLTSAFTNTKYILNELLNVGVFDTDVKNFLSEDFIEKTLGLHVKKTQYPLISGLIEHCVIPNLIIDEYATEIARKNAKNAVKPYVVSFKKGDKIILWLSNEELHSYKLLAEKTGMMFLTEAEIYFGNFARKFKEKFGHYESVGTLKEVESSDVIFVIGADFARENVGIKWSVMKAIRNNDAKVITIGLQRYDYDERTFLSLLADYADFAGEFHNIEHSEKSIYIALRKQIANNKKISIIVGNEYFCGEKDQESVLAFADFIGKDKLSAFIAAHDKLNYIGSLYAGGAYIDEVMKASPKVVFALAVNPSKGKDEALLNIIEKAEFYATPDMFLTGSVNNADVVLPVRAVLETDGTTISLDGRLMHMNKVVQAPISSKSNLEIAGMLGDYFRKKIETDIHKVFDELASSIGFSKEDYNKEDVVYGKKEKTFNKTNYTYKEHEHKECTVYVNPRHHEGVLTKIIYAYPEDKYPVFPEIEKDIEPGYKRFSNMEDNIAKGVKLIPR